MTIAEQILNKLKDNTRLKSMLALEMNKSIYTVQGWITENAADGPLTKIKALRIIASELGQDVDELLEDSKSTANI